MRHIHGIVVIALIAAGCTGFDLSYQPQGVSAGSICVAQDVGSTSSALVNLAGLSATGVDNGGNQLANGTVDPHYTASAPAVGNPGDPDYSLGDPACNTAVAIDPSLYATVGGAWASPPPNAMWITCATLPNDGTALSGVGPTYYRYSTKLTWPAGVPASTVTVTGNWACDNGCTIEVNNTRVLGASKGISSAQDEGNGVSSGHASLTPFTIPPGTFKEGANPSTITFVVYNASGPNPNPEGLLVSDITVSGGCKTDDQCAADGSQYCTPDDGKCNAKAPNGDPLPGGMVCPDGAARGCASGVCDEADSKCGYGTGGPCDDGNAAAVCRSGKCSVEGACLVADACQTDNDCADSTKWCNKNACTPKLDNGIALPSGMVCSDDGLTSVCKSGVCDTDGACGFINGNPCTSKNECRSGICGAAGTGHP